MTARRITIDIDDEAQTVSITDGEDAKSFESCALFAGDARNNVLLIKMYGSSADAAWAFGQGFLQSRIAGAGKALKNFYKQAVAHVCNIIDPGMFRNEVGADELLNKWECQDQSKWAGWDTEDVLEDKQVSEAKRKVLGPEAIVSEEPKKKNWN